MWREIKAKSLLSSVGQPDSFFGLRYNLNLYRGCQHRCIYCDSRSECYQIDRFDDEVLVKGNAIELLRKELAGKRTHGTIGTGAMNDPYMPLEEKTGLTRRILEVIAEFRFSVHIMTKSALVLRDLDVLKRISETYAAVSFTITTADDQLGKTLEPNASRVSERLNAMKVLADSGIYVGAILMPVLPFITDTPENILAIVSEAQAHGASYIIPSMGVTLRDRQREHFFEQLDKFFPGLREKFQKTFGDKYSCSAPNSGRLYSLFFKACKQAKIATTIKPYDQKLPQQLSF